MGIGTLPGFSLPQRGQRGIFVVLPSERRSRTKVADPDAAILYLLDRLRDRSPLQVDRALKIMSAADQQGAKAIDALLGEQIVTSLEIAEATASAWGLSSIDLSHVRIDPAAARLLPLTLSRRHAILVVAATDHTVTVATASPGDVVAIDDVRAATGRDAVLVIAAADDLRKAIDRYSRDTNSLDELGLVEEDLSQLIVSGDSDEPIVRYVTSLLEQAVSSRASDIHVEPTDGDLQIRYRIDGVLHEIETVPQSAMPALISRIKVMASMDIAERRLPQNGRITLPHGARTVDLRVATLPTVWGEKVVLRVLDADRIELDLAKLGFSDRNYIALTESLHRPHGLVLVTGPTGSGKSTTLYAALTAIGRPEVNIITVEDPVEYRLKGANQVQINAKAGLTFASVLPAILRSDPDVVLIGEIRDRDTAQLAIEAALTGHLVLSTLHTNDAPSSVSRLVEMGVEPFLLGSSLDAVMAQRLARRLCDWCKEAYEPTEEELASLAWYDMAIDVPNKLWKPVGCRVCSQTGYRGRFALHEIMPVTHEIERLTVSGASTQALRATAKAEGMLSLREDGLFKAAQGITSPVEVLRVAR
ncbi:MAG: type secretion system protein [Glaciihabitans sp.]|nr:type secretion system protein [Glaciihabitans sp.]